MKLTINESDRWLLITVISEAWRERVNLSKDPDLPARMKESFASDAQRLAEITDNLETMEDDPDEL